MSNNQTPSTASITETVVIEDSSDEEENNSLNWKYGRLMTAFEVLKKQKSNGNEPQQCSLLLIEVNLKEQVENYKGKLFGFAEGISSFEASKTAKKAIIIMVISLKQNWKIPVALFLTHTPNLKQLANRIQEIILELHNVAINICSVTLDCTSTHLNFNLAVELGGEIDLLQSSSTVTTYFKHPSTTNMIYIFFDLGNILAALKKYWASEKILCRNNQLLHYSVCLDVRKIQETDLGNYKLLNMYDWIIIRKRLNYDDEIVGKTTADAIHYLRNLGHPDYVTSGATIQFLKLVDWMCQFSQVGGEEGCLPHLSISNAAQWEPLIVKTLKYIKNLRQLNRGIPSHLCSLKTYVTGITVFFTSTLDMYLRCVYMNNTENIQLPYLEPFRFSLKHVTDSLYDPGTKDEKLTALSVYRQLQNLANTLHPISS